MKYSLEQLDHAIDAGDFKKNEDWQNKATPKKIIFKSTLG